MKKIYTFFALLLLCAVTAVAQTTVTIVDGTNAPFEYFGTRSSDKTTFTTNATSGMAGITIVAPVIDRHSSWWNNFNLALKPAAPQTTENVTVTVPDGYIIQDYSITLQAVSSSYPYDVTINGTTSNITGAAEKIFNPTINAKTTTFTIKQTASSVGDWLAVKRWTITVAVAIDVTYNLYDASDLTTVIATETVSQPINSAISIPSSLTSTYNTNYYTTTTSGTIGTTDCTIDVTRTLNNNAIVTNLANLSNDKAYTITCVRGTLTTDGSTIANTAKTDNNYTAKNFAIITKDDAYYLYSIEDEKYVASDGTLATYPIDASFEFRADLIPTFLFKYGSNYINTNNGLPKGSVIDSWGTPDDGNQFVIIEAGDFDPTNALEKFADRTPYYEALNAAITAAGNVPFGTTLHTYVKSADFDNALATAQSTYTDEDATIEELTAATQALTTAIDACELNMPTEGTFLRITSCHETILSGTPASGRLSLTTNADASTIFYFDGTKLLNYGNGVYANGRDAGSVGGDGISYWFEESTMKTGAYAIRFNPDGGSNRFLYAWGTDKNNADQNGTDHANCVFTLEEVTELPITLHSVDGTNYFATFSAPVPVRIEGATLNNVTPKANSISYKAVDTNLLPANTGVLLTGTSASATAYVVTDEVADAGYGLQAYDAAFTVAEADQTSKLFLGKGSQSGKAGFYKLGSAKTNGFKAYLNNTTELGGAKEGLELEFAGVTGIENMEHGTLNMENGAVYNLQGQRVGKAQKGVYIINNKKVVVK